MAAANIIVIVQVGSTIVGLVGGVLGILSWSRARKIQIHQLEEIESKKMKKTLEDEVFEELVKDAGMNILSRFWNPEVGSETFKIMERLVERGKLHRNEFGAFMIGSPTRLEG